MVKDQQFQVDFWPCDLNINRGHLVARSIRWTKSNNYLDISFTYSEDNTLNWENVTWNQCRTSTPLDHPPHQVWQVSITINKNILNGHPLVFKPTDRQIQNNMPPSSLFLKWRGHIFFLSAITLWNQSSIYEQIL